VRRAFGHDFLIGVSTHTPSEAIVAREGKADFATFGPLFDTPSKHSYGAPVGLAKLNEAARLLAPFPLIALGGINTPERALQAVNAGARGIAAIRLFEDAERLPETLRLLRRKVVLTDE
jgi:thiamine-phosphate pyrophosphorylase